MMFRKHDGARNRPATNCKNNLPLGVGGTYDFVLIGKTEELRTSLLNAEKEDLLDSDGVTFTRQP